MTDQYKPWVSVMVEVEHEDGIQDALGGKRREGWHIGTETNLGFGSLLGNVFVQVAEFYSNLGADPAWLNEELDKLKQFLAESEFLPLIEDVDVEAVIH